MTGPTFLTPQQRAHYLQAMGLGPLWLQRQAASLEPPIALAALADSAGVACAACQHCMQAGGANAVFDIALQANTALVVVGQEAGPQLVQNQTTASQENALLHAMLASILAPSQTAQIVHVVPCCDQQPTSTMLKGPQEVVVCQPFLCGWLASGAPKAALLMGSMVAQAVLQTQVSVSKLRGQVHSVPSQANGAEVETVKKAGGSSTGGKILAVVTHHPAHLLRQPADKAQAWEDLLLFGQFLKSS